MRQTSSVCRSNSRRLTRLMKLAGQSRPARVPSPTSLARPALPVTLTKRSKRSCQNSDKRCNQLSKSFIITFSSFFFSFSPFEFCNLTVRTISRYRELCYNTVLFLLQLSDSKRIEEQLRQQIAEKEEKTKKVFMGAKTKINQLNSEFTG